MKNFMGLNLSNPFIYLKYVFIYLAITHRNYINYYFGIWSLLYWKALIGVLMFWLKKFVKSMCTHKKYTTWDGCTCQNCLGPFESALILNSSKKLKINIKNEMINYVNHQDGDYADRPLVNELNDKDKSLILNDLIDELSEFEFPKSRNPFPESRISGPHDLFEMMLKPFIKILHEKGKKQELKRSILYSEMGKFYNSGI